MSTSGAASLTAGSRLGRFLIVQPLGSGTSGTVYLAEDTVLEERVALKVLAPQGEEVVTTRFKREILLARRISHPGVCRVFDLHEDGGHMFLTMEYVAGRTLEGILKDEGRLSAERSVGIAREVCRAVAAAHQAGILHRDLKPANIMIGVDRPPTVLDFGCAFAPQLQRVTRVGYVVGTARYLAPEILLRRADASEASDVYALGVIAFRCLTGRFPYVAHTIEQILEAVREDPPPPGSIAPDVGPAVDAVILRAVARDPANRYPSAAAFGEALDGCLVVKPAPPPRSRIARWGLGLDGAREPGSPWDERAAALEAELERKALVPGDDEALDRLLAAAARQKQQGHQGPAARFMELARDRVRKHRTDRTFMTAKLSRTQRALSTAPAGARPLLEVRLDAAADLVSARRLTEANVRLNEILDELA